MVSPREREDGGSRDGDIEQRDEVDGREAVHDPLPPGRDERRGTRRSEVGCRTHNHPSRRYQSAVRPSPEARSTRGCHPVSRINASDRQVHAGARNSAALSADRTVARPATWASDPIAHKRPRASSAGRVTTRGSRPTARPIARTKPRLVVTVGCAAKYTRPAAAAAAAAPRPARPPPAGHYPRLL